MPGLDEPTDINDLKRRLESRNQRLKVDTLFRWGVSLATMYALTNDPAALRAVDEHNDVMTYVEQRVPQGKKIQVVYRVRPYVGGEVMVPGTYEVYPTGTPHLPAGGKLPDNTRYIVREIWGKGSPGDVKVSQDVLADIRAGQDIVIESAERVGPVMTTAGPELPKAVVREVKLVVDTIEQHYRDKPGTGGGGGPADPADPTGDDAPWAGDDDTDIGPDKDPPPPVILDLPLPDTGVAVASVERRAFRTAAAKAAAKPAKGGAEAVTAKGTTKQATSAAVTQGSLEVHRAIRKAIGLPPPPPVPPHPATGLPTDSYRVESEKIRKYAGKAVGPLGSPGSLLRVVNAVVESTVRSPLRLPKDDPYGDVSWTRMQLAGRWRPAVEKVSPGDLVRVADGTATDGGYWAMVVTSPGGRPEELLVPDDQDETFQLWQMPPSAAVVAAWQPRPAPAFADTNPIGAWWGPKMKRFDAFVSAFVDGTAGVRDLAAFLAPPRSNVADDRELLALVMPQTGGVGPFRPLWPGSVVFGFDQHHLGVVLPSGHVAGGCPWGRFDNLVRVMSVRRFQPAFVWYPGVSA